MNVNVHAQDKFWNLGQIPVHGSLTSEKMLSDIKVRLEKFGLNFEDDIVCSITDGASVMVKFGTLTNSLHQLCFAHGIHLAICDVIYDKNKTDADDEESGDEDGDDDDEDIVPSLRDDIKCVVKDCP